MGVIKFESPVAVASRLFGPCCSHGGKTINSNLSVWALCKRAIRLSLIFSLSAPRRVHLRFDIEGTPSCFSHDTLIALALILIDGTVAHLLKAAYIYLPGLYMHTNSNCFLPPALGRLPGRLWEVKHYHLMSPHLGSITAVQRFRPNAAQKNKSGGRKQSS